MKQDYRQIAEQMVANIIEAIKRIPARAALFVVILAATLTLVFGARPDALQIGLSAATLPQSGEAQTEQAQTEQAEKTQTLEERFAARVGITHQAIDLSRGVIDARKITPLPAEKLAEIDSETLWLARCLYSETNRIEEMELVAWAIRNRVETSYRGQNTYKSVVLDPWQFSAFNSNSPKRSYFMNLTPSSEADKWEEALTIAHVVKNAPASMRPFSKQTRHYYSERSMVGVSKPAWAVNQEEVAPNRPFELEAQRFRFYENIA